MWFSVFLSSPQYSVLCCILSLVACGVFLRVSFELKVLFLTLASTVYYVIILTSKLELFEAYGKLLFNQTVHNWNCSRWILSCTVEYRYWQLHSTAFCLLYSPEDTSILRCLGLVKHPQVMSCIYITLFLVTMLIISQQVSTQTQVLK